MPLIRDIVEGKPPVGLAASAAAGVLSAMSLAYRAAIKIRTEAYDHSWKNSKRLPCPIICVGNLTVGGTGKTPVTAALVQLLIHHGHRPVIISRGYGATARKSTELAIISRGDGPIVGPEVAGDEPYLLARMLPKTPVVVCADRYAAGMKGIEEFQPDCIVMDDGFQHRQLHRDFDFVLIDASRDPQSMHLFPRGPLREDFPALGRASMIGLTRADQSQFLPQWHAIAEENASGKPLVEIAFEPVLPEIEEPVLGFCAIGNPQAFFESLEKRIKIAATRAFPDHHVYTADDLRELSVQAQLTGARTLVTTEKDEAKLGRLPHPSIPITTVGIQTKWDDAAIARHITSVFAAAPAR